MKHSLGLATAFTLLIGAVQAFSQSYTATFDDGTQDSWTGKFGAPKTFPIISIAGNNEMLVLRTGAFQEAEVAHGADGSDFYNAMAAANANPAGYMISYDYFIDTSGWGSGAGNFFQLGTYINFGNGTYAQDFGTPKEVELSGAQCQSGQVFSGHVSFNVNTVYPQFAANPGQTFFRLGLIENGDGAAQGAFFDNISVSPVPEPASLALLGLGAAGLIMIRRKNS
jgi:hypothetical protein